MSRPDTFLELLKPVRQVQLLIGHKLERLESTYDTVLIAIAQESTSFR
jgi:hypothetical protein